MDRFSTGTPTGLIGGFLTFVGLGLGCVWLGLWAAYVFAGRATPIDPEAFKLVAALDLALMVPALIVEGVLYLLVLSVNSIVFIRRGLAAAPGELPIWGSLTVLTSAAALLLLSRIER